MLVACFFSDSLYCRGKTKPSKSGVNPRCCQTVAVFNVLAKHFGTADIGLLVPVKAMLHGGFGVFSNVEGERFFSRQSCFVGSWVLLVDGRLIHGWKPSGIGEYIMLTIVCFAKKQPGQQSHTMMMTACSTCPMSTVSVQ